MQYNQFRKDCSRFLEVLAESLDIPTSLHDKAKDRYEAVGAWLDRKDGPLSHYKPDIHPQGSFRVGTVIKPISDKDHYDIDLVCTLQCKKTDLTQEQLKDALGNELVAYAKANNMKSIPEDKRRCWRMEYADGVSFHMDILPAIPDDKSFVLSLIQAGVPAVLATDALAITDEEHENYSRLSNGWPKSNPKGYAGWFIERMKVCQEEMKRHLVVMQKYAKVDDVPDFAAKTPLQRAVQLLKRHRDIMFRDDSEDKPISIIISTLAAYAYNNEADLLEALIGIVEEMENHIRIVNGEVWVANPVNHKENFADKWPGTEKGQKFREWFIQVKADLSQALDTHDLDMFADGIGPVFGGEMIKTARARMETEKRGSLSIIKRASMAISKFNVSWRKPADWPARTPVRIGLTAYVSEHNGFRSYTYRYRSGGEYLAKGLTIRFVAETDNALGNEFYWQITNTGDEARWAGDLRGGFQVDGRVHEEKTKYSGEHCVQCFVVKDGICLARSDEFVVKIR